MTTENSCGPDSARTFASLTGSSKDARVTRPSPSNHLSDTFQREVSVSILLTCSRRAYNIGILTQESVRQPFSMSALKPCGKSKTRSMWSFRYNVKQSIYEPRCEKTGLRCFRPGLTQTGLYSHRRWLEA